jgi:GT2 family glycosyltransferase
MEGQVIAPNAENLQFRLDGETINLRRRGLPARAVRSRQLAVTLGTNRHLVGSPINLTAHRRVHGFVEASEGGLSGWVHQPSRPDTPPPLTLVDARNHRRALIPQNRAATAQGPLVRPWNIGVMAAELGGLQMPIRVVDGSGHDLSGSPIDPQIETHAAYLLAGSWKRGVPEKPPLFVPTGARLRGPAPPASPPAPAAVVILVRTVGPALAACLRSMVANTPDTIPVLLIDDGTEDREGVRAMLPHDRGRAIRLIRHPRLRGFPAAANTGIRAAGRRDVILLRGDALVPPRWVERLRAAAYAAADTGSASPFETADSILGYPSPDEPPRALTPEATRRLAGHAHRANGDETVEVPASSAICAYIRRACLDDVGAFREDLFAQGSGEAIDFCLRARHRGWRHVAATGLIVGCAETERLRQSERDLMRRNLDVIERLHPGWNDLVAEFETEDPLRHARRRIDRHRWREAGRAGSGSVLLVTHDDGGGVERVVAARCRALTAIGQRPIVLRPTGIMGARLDHGTGGDHPNLVFRLPDELPDLLDLLRASTTIAVEYHHTLGHHPSVLTLAAALSVPHDVRLHDYVWICPQVTLVARGRYCDEPDVSICEYCVADNGRMTEEDIPVRTLRARSAAFLADARHIVAPSADAAARVQRYAPAATITVEAHEDDSLWPETRWPGGAAPSAAKPLVVAVTGAIGIDKGFEVLLACARDAEARGLPLSFVLAGHCIDDRRLLATGRCHVTGPYAADEAAALLAAAGAALGFIPSVWPETWCFALSDIWSAGLPAVAFDIGAPAERIRRSGRGLVLPLGLGAGAVNDALLATARRIGQKDLSARSALSFTPTRLRNLSHTSSGPISETSRHV